MAHREKPIGKIIVLFVFFILSACSAQIPTDLVKSETESNEPQLIAPDQDAQVETNLELPNTPQSQERKIKIAILLPLSGEVSETGKALLNAATMALFDAYDPRLQLLPYDTKADSRQTEIVSNEAISDGVDIIIGPLLSANVKIAGRIAGKAGVPLLGFSNDYSAASQDNFILGFLPENEVRRVVNYAVEQGYKSFAGLFPEGQYGDQVRSAYGIAVNNSHANISTIETYENNAEQVFDPVKSLADYDRRRRAHRNEVRFLKSLNDDMTDEIVQKMNDTEVLGDLLFDAVIVPEGGALLRTLAPLLPFYEVDTEKVKVLGTGLWNDITLTNEPPLYGAWFAAPDPTSSEAFFNRYEELYGETPVRITTLAYDAVGMIAVLAREGIQQQETSESVEVNYFTRKALTDPRGFKGVDGLFRLLPDGTNERALAVLEIQKGKFSIVSPVPDAFPAFGYSLMRAALPE